jgi:hypothetical protein
MTEAGQFFCIYCIAEGKHEEDCSDKLVIFDGLSLCLRHIGTYIKLKEDADRHNRLMKQFLDNVIFIQKKKIIE